MENVEITSQTFNADAILAGSSIPSSAEFITATETFVKGDSAYKTWTQQEGNEGKTEQEFFDWIQSPATSIEEIVALAEEARVLAENIRLSNEEARVLAEGIRSSAETARQNKEAERVLSEIGREDSEGERSAAETARIQAEIARGNAESDREESEDLRSTSETIRQTNEGERQQSETARSTAEGLRVLAETSREEAETDRETAEELRVQAETARANEWNNTLKPDVLAATEAANAVADSKLDKSAVKQVTGESLVDVMSQKAVTEELLKLPSKVGYDIPMLLGGGYLNEDGNVIAAPRYDVSDFIPVIPGDKVIYTGTSGISTCAMIGYNESKAGAVVILGVNTTYLEEIVTIPDGVYYIRISGKNLTYSGNTIIASGVLSANPVASQAYIRQEEFLFSSSEDVDFSEISLVDRRYINLNGILANSTLNGCFPIQLEGNSFLDLTISANDQVAVVSKYNSTFNNFVPLVLGIDASATVRRYLIPITEDGEYYISGRIGTQADATLYPRSLTIFNSNVCLLQSFLGIKNIVIKNSETVTELYNRSYKISPFSTEMVSDPNTIVNGVISTQVTSARYIYYKQVNAGDLIGIQGENTNSTKPVEWGFYNEIPTSGLTTENWGNTSEIGKIKRIFKVDQDGYFALALNLTYHKNFEIGEAEDSSNTVESFYNPTKIKYIPHRGVRDSEIPENTTYSVMFAALYGIKYAECDVRYTSDGVGVVMHDPSINRTMYNGDLSTISGSVLIADNTYDTLSQYVYKSTNPVYRTKLQTMKEYIDACASWDICPIIQGSMSNDDLAYCMQKLGDNWICYGGNFTKVRTYSQNVLCLTSASYASVDAMVSALKKIGGRVGLSRLYNDQLTDDYISACKENGWEVMASYAYQEQNIPDAIRRGVTIVLADNMGKETNKILASSLSDWDSFTHGGTVANGVLNLSVGQTLTYNLENKGNYKIFAQFSGTGLFNIPSYNNSGILEMTDFPMDNEVFQYVFLITTGGHNITITASTDLLIERLIICYEEN